MNADGTHMPLVGTGPFSTSSLYVSAVYYIPNLTLSFAFVSQLCDSGYDVNFSKTSCRVQDPQPRRLIGQTTDMEDSMSWMS